MARRQIDWSAGTGRDQGKTYTITEAPAHTAEMWALRASLATVSRGVEFDGNLAKLGGPGWAFMLMRAFAGSPFELMAPIVNEMMTCVQFKPATGIGRPLVPDDIEEVATRVALKREVLELHLGFTIADGLSMLASALPAPSTEDTSTSPPSAEA